MPSTLDKEATNTRIGAFRWVICALLFLGTMVNYIDRQIIGILKPDLAKEFHWSDTDYANIVACFQFAYAFGYLFGGRMMDRVGVKRGYPIVAFLWSLACAAHGVARSVAGFATARLGLGLSEGGNFPAAIKVVGEWFPIKERALATGLFNSASNVGAIVCPFLVPLVARLWGWPATFYVTGGLGVLWVGLWMLTYDKPENHKHLGQAERDYISQGKPAQAEPVAAKSVSWTVLLSRRAPWAYMVANMLTGPVWWFYLFWLPDFLKINYHLDKDHSAPYIGAVYAISIVGSVGGGWLSMALLKRYQNHNLARKGALFVFGALVLPVFFAPYCGNPWWVVALVGLAAAGHQGYSANLYTFVTDTTPKAAVSSVTGLGGFAGGIAAIAVAKAVGYILDLHIGYAPVFAWASTMYLLALLIMHLLVPKINPDNIQELPV